MKKGRGRRQIVWTFYCVGCGDRRDFLAKRRPTSLDPSADLPKIVQCLRDGRFMKNEGLFYLTLLDGPYQIKTREAAGAIRAEWDRKAESFFRGKTCDCGHEWWGHQPLATFKLGACGSCSCGAFTHAESARAPMPELGHDEEVPF